MIFQAPSRRQKRYRCLIIMFVYRCLLTKCLHGKVVWHSQTLGFDRGHKNGRLCQTNGKAAVLQQIMFEKQRNLFVQGYSHTYLVLLVSSCGFMYEFGMISLVTSPPFS